MSVNMMAASLRCSIFSGGTNELNQSASGRKYRIFRGQVISFILALICSLELIRVIRKSLSEQFAQIATGGRVERQLARAAPAFRASKRIFTTEIAEVAEINQRWMQRHVASASSVSSVVNPAESDN